MESPILNDMMMFLAVVDKLSFTAAAKQFRVTKSVISKRITRLEKALGVQLIYRSTRRLSLTEAGSILYEHCVNIRNDIEEAENAVTAAHAEPQGVLRVNAPSSFATLHLAPAISDFMKLHSKLSVQMLIGSTYEDLIDSGIDLSIRIGNLPDSTLMARRITARRLRVCAAPSYLKKHAVPRKPEDLMNHNCLIHRDHRGGDEWHFVHKGKDIKVAVNGNFSSTTSQTLEAAAVSGLGIVMLPGYMMTPDIKAGRLISLLDDYCPKNIGIYAVYPQTSHVPVKVRTFIDFLCERFGEEEYWS